MRGGEKEKEKVKEKEKAERFVTDDDLFIINQQRIKYVKVKFMFTCSIFFQFTFIKIDPDQVMKDFGKKFDTNRFSQEILVVHQNDQDNKYDSIVVSRNNIGKYWKEINKKFGRCDYVARQEGSDANSFLIFTDKGWEKYLIVYNSKDKISKIRFIRPKPEGPPIPPPCGY